MNDAEINLNANGLIYKTSVITGWRVPDDKTYLMAFQDQLRKKILESYHDLNPDEFEYAMRTYGVKIKDWGKEINLSLIDEAIQYYKAHRLELSNYEERSKREVKSISPGPVDWSDEFDRVSKALQEGKDPIITTALYDWMDRSGKIFLTVEQKNEFMAKAVNEIIGEKEVEKLNGFDRGAINDLHKLKSGEWKQDNRLSNKIVNRAKILAIKDLAW